MINYILSTITHPNWHAIFAGLVFLTASVVIMIFILNRFILPMKYVYLKRTLMILVSSSVVATSIWGAYFGTNRLIILPVITLFIASLHKIILSFKKRKYKGSPPFSIKKYCHSFPSLITTYDICIKEYETVITNLPCSEITIAHISDLHLHPDQDDNFFSNVFNFINKEEPDFVFITGDFISRQEHLPLIKKKLKNIKSKQGTFAILGNHDYWLDYQAIINTLKDLQIEYLGNSYKYIRFQEGEICIAGCEVPWTNKRWSPPKINKNTPLFILSHTADNIFMLNNHNADIVFTGHYHGGQISLPLFGPIIIPSKYGNMFDKGHYIVNNTELFVSTGLGAIDPPVRILCHPEIIIVKIKKQPSS